MSTAGTCTTCGAPYGEGLACCAYCDTPIPGRVAGVRCPNCREVATADARSCPLCSFAFTKGCVFCGQSAFLTAPSCPRCNEAFEGAEERKKQREAAAQQQRMMNLASQGIAAAATVAGSPSGRQMIGGLFDMIVRLNDDIPKG